MTAAWEQDEGWGTLVWLVMVTGLRRAELLALKWLDVDFAGGKLTFAVTTSGSQSAGLRLRLGERRPG